MDKKLAGYFGFERPEVCPLALEAAAGVYGVTKHFPKTEQSGLANRLRRAAAPIMLDAAVGKGRNSGGGFRRFPCQARGSLLETASAVQTAKLPALLDTSANDSLLDKASKLNAKLNAPIIALKVEQ